MSLTERKAGSGAVDPDDFNALVDAVAALQAGGGGTQNPADLARASYNGNQVTIADGDTADLTWDTLGDGDAMLNLSNPSAPLMNEEGVYAVTAIVQGITLTVDGYFDAVLHLDADGGDAIGQQQSRPSVAGGGHSTPIAGVLCTYYVPAGGKLKVQVTNKDGAAGRDFFIVEALIQRVI